MNENFDLQEYLAVGIEHLVAGVVKATLKNPKESAFMLKFAAAAASASGKRKAGSAGGAHPRFPDRQYHQPVQSALRGMLLPLQQCHSGCGAHPAVVG